MKENPPGRQRTKDALQQPTPSNDLTQRHHALHSSTEAPSGRTTARRGRGQMQIRSRVQTREGGDVPGDPPRGKHTPEHIASTAKGNVQVHRKNTHNETVKGRSIKTKRKTRNEPPTHISARTQPPPTPLPSPSKRRERAPRTAKNQVRHPRGGSPAHRRPVRTPEPPCSDQQSAAQRHPATVATSGDQPPPPQLVPGTIVEYNNTRGEK